jgi:xanthocillin biosynthesis cytochrome P450 monooxygenase
VGLIFAASVAVSLLGVVLWWYIHIPLDMPKNIPSVPICVSLLGLWSDMGQDEIYERWLQKPLERRSRRHLV